MIIVIDLLKSEIMKAENEIRLSKLNEPIVKKHPGFTFMLIDLPGHEKYISELKLAIEILLNHSK